VGGASSTYGRGEESVQGFWWESPKERDRSENRGVDGRMGPMTGFFKYDDKPSGSAVTELVIMKIIS
jgi:hypothetical protein